MSQKRISLVLDQPDRSSLNEFLIIFIINRRSTSQDHLIILKTLSHLYHGWQIILDFLQTTTSQQSYNRLSCVQIILNTELSVCLMIIRSELIHFLCRRIAYIMNRILVFFLKEINLKRQDGKEFGYIPLDTADTPFLPCPYLRRYIIVSRYQSVLFQKLSNIQIKTRIIYKNHHIRFPFHNILLAFFHIGKDGTQMQENRHKTHICQFLIMLDTGSTFGSHQVTAEETKLCQFIHFFQRAHQSAGMQITTCLAYYQIILHILA